MTISLPQRIVSHLWRATWLLCPACGTQPIFRSVRRTRSLHTWFTPLNGCPHCAYRYEREPNYFLTAQWTIGYFAAAFVGIGVYVFLQTWHSDLSTTWTLLAVAVPLPVVNILFARHAKAYFLAIDHLCDPHIQPSADSVNDGLSIDAHALDWQDDLTSREPVKL